MNSATYKNILRLLEQWPLDLTKSGRDVGEFIRKQVGNYFIVNNARNVNEGVWQEIVSRLNRITSDHYKKKFPVSQNTSSTGLTEAQCHEVVSNEFLDVLKEENTSASRSVVEKVKSKFKGQNS